MKRFLLITLLLVFFSVSGLAQTNKIESVYTDLAEKYCKTIESPASGAFWYRGECPGIAGYKLEVLDGDERQDLNIISPSGDKRELGFFENVSPAFSTLGAKVEWRVSRAGRQLKPIALIVRFETNEDPENPYKITSYLVVIRVTADSACITNIVKPMENQNMIARTFADKASDNPCPANAKIPKLIFELADKNESVADSASDQLIKIGPSVIAPLLESLTQIKLCEFQFISAKVIQKIDPKQTIVKSILFDVASGKCGYRYSPEKYLPDANLGSILSQHNAAALLVTEIDGGIDLLPELLKNGGSGHYNALYAFLGLFVMFEDKRREKAVVKPEIIRGLKASIPMLVKALEINDARLRCDFYDVLQWMQTSDFEELRVESKRALQGKTVNCSK